MSNQQGSYLAVIKVVGIGGGGTNAVTRMVEAGLSGVEFVGVNTDADDLDHREVAALLVAHLSTHLKLKFALNVRSRDTLRSRG